MDKLEFESMTLCPLDGRYGKIKDQLADYSVNMHLLSIECL